MKQWSLYLFVILLSLSSFDTAQAQIEARLATNCATKQIEIPVQFKNLENIKSIHLKLRFDTTLVHFDSSMYHHSNFELENKEEYRITTSVSNDTIFIDWAAYYGVNVEDGLFLSLLFTEKAGVSGEAAFAWLEEGCRFTNVTDLNIDASYLVDGSLPVPYESEVEIDFEQFTIGCRDDSENGGCKAQAEVNITGGISPYIYKWNDKFNQNDSIAIGLCQDPVSVIIRDAAGCIYGDLFKPQIYAAAVYDILATPEEVFITKPDVEFAIVTDDSYIEKYEWDFGDESNGYSDIETHTYQQVGTYDISLYTENIDGCDTIVYLNTFEVKELNFCIPNVFTPNGDGVNDTWIFKIIGAEGGGDDSVESFKSTGIQEVTKCTGDDLIFDEHFQSTELVIFNRNGSKLFDCINCTDDWDGGGLPDGVYFYVFTWVGEYSNGVEQGSVTILGGQN